MSDNQPSPTGASPQLPPGSRGATGKQPTTTASAAPATGPPLVGSTITPGQGDIGVKGAPTGWVAAERDAPAPPSLPRRRRSRGGTVPAIRVQRESTFIANAVAAATGFVAASVWYLADVAGLYEGPWAPVAAALMISGSIRLFSKAHPTQRTVVSTVTYLLVLLIVVILLTHHDLVGIYGEIDDYRTYEESLVRSRLQHPLHLVAYGVGGIVAAVVPAVRDRR